MATCLPTGKLGQTCPTWPCPTVSSYEPTIPKPTVLCVLVGNPLSHVYQPGLYWALTQTRWKHPQFPTPLHIQHIYCVLFMSSWASVLENRNSCSFLGSHRYYVGCIKQTEVKRRVIDSSSVIEGCRNNRIWLLVRVQSSQCGSILLLCALWSRDHLEEEWFSSSAFACYEILFNYHYILTTIVSTLNRGCCGLQDQWWWTGNTEFCVLQAHKPQKVCTTKYHAHGKAPLPSLLQFNRDPREMGRRAEGILSLNLVSMMVSIMRVKVPQKKFKLTRMVLLDPEIQKNHVISPNQMER